MNSRLNSGFPHLHSAIESGPMIVVPVEERRRANRSDRLNQLRADMSAVIPRHSPEATSRGATTLDSPNL